MIGLLCMVRPNGCRHKRTFLPRLMLYLMRGIGYCELCDVSHLHIFIITSESHQLICSVFLVFEYCAHDLGRLLDTMPRRFHESEVKCLLKQVCCCHQLDS